MLLFQVLDQEVIDHFATALRQLSVGALLNGLPPGPSQIGQNDARGQFFLQN